jgi:hypothetical protein
MFFTKKFINENTYSYVGGKISYYQTGYNMNLYVWHQP